MPIKYFKRIRLKNFESHKNTEIDLHPGINVIVGNSDCGKSSILRALAWLCYNNASGVTIRESMRQDAERRKLENAKRASGDYETVVEVELSDGYRVQRIRGLQNTNNKYVIISPDGEEQTFSNFKQAVPPQVEEILGFEAYNLAGRNKVLVNYMSQNDLPVTMAVKDSELSQLLNLSNNLDCFDEAHQRLRAKTQGNGELSQLIRVLRNHMDEQEIALSKLPNMSEHIESIDKLMGPDGSIAKLENIEKKIEVAQEIISSYSDLYSRAKRVSSALHHQRRIADLQLPLANHSGNADSISSAFSLCASYVDILKRLKENKESLTRYDKVSQVKPDELAERIGRVESSFVLVNKYVDLLSKVSKSGKNKQAQLERIQTLGEEITELSTQRIDIIARECETCPMCGEETTDTSRDKIREYLEAESG